MSSSISTHTASQPPSIQPETLPLIGFLRLPQVLAVIPVSKTTWWDGVREGRYPPSVKLSSRVTVWHVEDIRALLETGPTGAFQSNPSARMAKKGATGGKVKQPTRVADPKNYERNDR